MQFRYEPAYHSNYFSHFLCLMFQLWPPVLMMICILKWQPDQLKQPRVYIEEVHSDIDIFWWWRHVITPHWHWFTIMRKMCFWKIEILVVFCSLLKLINEVKDQSQFQPHSIYKWKSLCTFANFSLKHSFRWMFSLFEETQNSLCIHI